MKISKWIQVEQEVEVEVSAEDIASAFAEDPYTSRQALVAINNFAQVLKGLTPDMIEDMGAPARTTIAAFFTEQAARFNPTTT
jgi:hypothetical protein